MNIHLRKFSTLIIYIVNVFFFFGRFAQNYQKIDSKNFQTFIFL